MRGSRGFTLIELLIVIAIIAILASLSVVFVTGRIERARELKTRTLIENLHYPLTDFSDAHPQSHFPDRDASDDLTVTMLEQLQPFDTLRIRDSDVGESPSGAPCIVDGWGTPLKYLPWRGVLPKPANAHNKATYDLWSAGSDANYNTEADNITNWTSRTR